MADSQVPLSRLRDHRRVSVNPEAFAIGIFLIVTLSKLASYLTPYKMYFSFSAFMFSGGEQRWHGLAIKLLIPSIAGYLLYAVPFRWLAMTRSNSGLREVYRYLAREAATTARLAGFFSALLMAWPFLAFWDVLMEPSLQHLRLQFLVVYFLYFVAYAYFADLGVSLARLSVRSRLPSNATRDLNQGISWLSAVHASLMGTVTSAIATFLVAQLASAD